MITSSGGRCMKQLTLRFRRSNLCNRMGLKWCFFYCEDEHNVGGHSGLDCLSWCCYCPSIYVVLLLAHLVKVANNILSRRSWQWERLSASVLSICSSVCLYVCPSVAKMQKSAIFSKCKQFRAMVLLTTYSKSYIGFSKNPLLDP